MSLAILIASVLYLIHLTNHVTLDESGIGFKSANTVQHYFLSQNIRTWLASNVINLRNCRLYKLLGKSIQEKICHHIINQRCQPLRNILTSILN